MYQRHSIRKEEKNQMGDLRIVESFTVGGTKAGPSMPGPQLQRMLGTRIVIDIATKSLVVPTRQGPMVARQGDTINLWSDDSLEVEPAE